jgi:mRNA interferase MazF
MVSCPERGDVIWLDFEPQTGREIMKRRPALVLSAKIYNEKSNLCIVCPISSKMKGHRLEVPIKVARKNGVIKADQIKSLDWRLRRAVFIHKADKQTLEKVCEIVDALIWEDD